MIITTHLVGEFHDNLLVNVVHVFVVSTGDVDLGDDAGLQAVHQLAQDDAVAQSLLVRYVGKPLPDHRFDPLLGFLLLLGFTLARALELRKYLISIYFSVAAMCSY